MIDTLSEITSQASYRTEQRRHGIACDLVTDVRDSVDRASRMGRDWSAKAIPTAQTAQTVQSAKCILSAKPQSRAHRANQRLAIVLLSVLCPKLKVWRSRDSSFGCHPSQYADPLSRSACIRLERDYACDSSRLFRFTFPSVLDFRTFLSSNALVLAANATWPSDVSV